MPFLTNRRTFLKQTSLLSIGSLLSIPLQTFASSSNKEDLDAFFKERLVRDHIPGLTACAVRKNQIVWSNGYGYADLSNKTPMDPKESLQNIGSVSKTVVATAVMQLWEQEKIGLEQDVNEYLPFPVRNPNHPEHPITARQLLIHRSSIKDGPAYGLSYACGDPDKGLGDWLRDYLTTDGAYYNPAENFHPWAPGTSEQFPFPPPNYTNVGFGLLALLVENVSAIPFYDYCRKHIFDPLEMKGSGWFIKDIDRSKHAVPYDYLPPDFQLPPGLPYERLLPQKEEAETPLTPETYFPHCLYSFPNYPDGLLRTTAVELGHFMIAYLNGGLFKNDRILQATTIEQMLMQQLATDPMQGLCWQRIQVGENDFVWGHSGGDPGINTFVMMDPSNQTGAIVLTNSSQGNLFELTFRLLQEEW